MVRGKGIWKRGADCLLFRPAWFVLFVAALTYCEKYVLTVCLSVCHVCSQGGTVSVVSVVVGEHVLQDEHVGFEDGTINFLSFPAVVNGKIRGIFGSCC